ncbi:MAG TPA: class I SAM-dependent methyltransferase [Bryobacteraceae bacterium]|nr:class I SAM-dependent methyltransferase [Bryobacteraceae bacterium]
MTRLIANLPSGARVLDLGAASGSFSNPRSDVAVIRVDLEPPVGQPGSYVAADAAQLPFPTGAFDLIVSNHSLEHLERLEVSVAEIGRVLKPFGAIYIAVPDATTLTDRIYRWLGRGGGHVNAFRSPGEVVALIERLAKSNHRATQDLSSGLSFLNVHNFHTRPPRKIALFAFGNERFLAIFIWLLRSLDHAFGTRLSLYGWAFYFGAAVPPESLDNERNVCVRCGAGHSEDYLRSHATGWRRTLGIETYRCPACGGFNLFTADRSRKVSD